MKTLFGLILIVLGVVLGLYMGFWVCFIGGIVQVVESFKETPVDALGVAFGFFRFFFSGVVGWGTFLLTSGLGAAIAD